MQEVVENIPLEKLKPFPNHPFKIREDEAIQDTGERGLVSLPGGRLCR